MSAECSRSELESLARRFGTPIYIYSLDRITEAYADLLAQLPAGTEVLYSVKANPHPAIIGHLTGLGAGLEISSTGELDAARQAGGRPERCFFTGPAKTAEEIDLVLEAGVRRFSVESAAQLSRIEERCAAAGAEAECLIRLNLPSASLPPGLAMTGRSPFGADVTEIQASPGGYLGGAHSRVIGVHCFTAANVIGSGNILSLVAHHLDCARIVMACLGTSPKVVNVGGGFAAPYATAGARPKLDLAAELERLFARAFPGHPDGPVFTFEAGRYLVGECGTLICSVVEVRKIRDRTFVILDAGINAVGGLTGIGRMLPLSKTAVLRLDADGDARPDDVACADFAGPLCTPADVIGKELPAGDLQAGDLVAIPNVGAYGLTASLIGFLGRPIPAEVVVDRGRVISASRLRLERREIPAAG
jgi:diaminopimelate decarboxylase